MRVSAVFLILLSVSAFGKPLIIKPNNENITIIGRAEVKKDKTIFSHAGVQIRFDFKGRSLAVGLTDMTNDFPENLNFYNVYINDSLIKVIKVMPSKKWYNIDYLFNDIMVEVSIFKRTEAMCGGAIFQGLKVSEGSEIHKTKLKSRKIEWIGDSFTAGYGNLVSNPIPPEGNPTTGFNAKNEDNSLAWGSVASKSLNAEYMCTAFSGKGVYRNYDKSEEETLPKIYNLIAPGLSDEKWDFLRYQPDLIVVNLGQNDFGPETHSIPVMTDSLRFTTAYLELLEMIRAHNTNAKILITIGGGLSDYYPTNFKRLSRSRLWLKNISQNFNKRYPGICSVFELQLIKPPYGEDWHPSLKSHQLMADQAIVIIKKFMNW